ncbi:MAG: rRNA methyltransferase [Flavobacterium sp. BFFFF2]|nr:MAG: rRNA methyltransferase [Flavobacterium sp. BFFFF2]
MHLSSAQNQTFKYWLSLKEKSRERRKSGLFLIEGKREIQLALKGGYLIESLIWVPEIMGENEDLSWLPNQVQTYSITPDLYAKLAYRETTEGMLAVAQSKTHSISDLVVKSNPLVLVAEGIEKPGNLGALLRTADAAGVDAVLLTDCATDIYNPNVIRSAVGCVFTTPIAVGTSADCIQFLQDHNINIFAATLQNANVYTACDFSAPTALVVGAEANGLTEIWRKAAHQNMIIPMAGVIDSMNVSVAAAICMFEAVRQRSIKR